MFIEFEKIYSNVFFVGDEYDNAVKKRYAGLLSTRMVLIYLTILNLKSRDLRQSAVIHLP